jgi:Na+-transporting methylmalonyl-CoA/oxaloacetate decarboxylase gamma subunit
MFISKRVLIIIGVAAVLVVGLIVFAFVLIMSQANQTAAITPTPTPTVASTATPAKPTLRACALGIVQSIGASSFVVAENKGAKTVTVMVDDTTIIRKHGAKVTLSSLAVGDQVRVTSQTTCDKTAPSFTAQNIMVILKKAATPTPTATP